MAGLAINKSQFQYLSVPWSMFLARSYHDCYNVLIGSPYMSIQQVSVINVGDKNLSLTVPILLVL